MRLGFQARIYCSSCDYASQMFFRRVGSAARIGLAFAIATLRIALGEWEPWSRVTLRHRHVPDVS